MQFSRGSAKVLAGASAMTLALTACGNDSDGGSGSDASDASGGSSDGTGRWPTVTTGQSGVQDDIQDISNFCGDEPIKVGLADGFGGNSWRKITRAIFEAEAAQCENITDVIYTDAQSDTQKAISDINSMVAQGVNVIVTFPDAGEALLPTIKKATEAGVAVVPYIATPGGEVGVDYVDNPSENVNTYGKLLADWTIEHMGGEGNLVMLGGIAGNSYSQAVYDGVTEAVKENPGVKLLNTDGPVATDWEPGKTQQVVAGLITKYDQIDGVVADYGGGSVGGIRAFLAADQPLPVWTANDSNEFACLWYEYAPDQPTFQIATESSRNWMVTVALHKGLAAYNGIENTEPSTYNLEIIEDSTDESLQPQCEEDLPPDAILSSGLSVDELVSLFE